GDRTPGLLQPFEIRLEAAGCSHDSARADRVLDAVTNYAGRAEALTGNVEPDDFGVVADLYAELLGASVVGVDERLAAAQEERVGARHVQRSAERGLEAHAVCMHPLAAGRGEADRHPREPLVRLPARDREQEIGR